MRPNAIDWIATILLIIGGLNWGLVGLFDWNLVAELFGETSVITDIIYVVVGIAALWALYLLVRMGQASATPGERV